MPSQFLPPWSKPHHPKLSRPRADYQASSSASLEADTRRSRHVPGKARNDGSGRRAGHAEVGHSDEYSDRDDAVGVKREITQRLGNIDPGQREEMKGVAHAYENGDLHKLEDKLDELFEDRQVVVSVRDIKELIRDEKLEHPGLHGKARFVLPVTESNIKDQRWVGREEQEKKKQEEHEKQNQAKEHDDAKGDSQTKDSKQDDQSQSKDQKERGKTDGEGKTDTKDPKEVDPTEGLSEKDKRFFQAVMDEGKHLEDLKNHDGKPLPRDHELLEDLNEQQVSMGVQVDDQFTPDSWIPRSSHLLRLTGKHPLNAEPNLTELFEAGFQTPIKLHYVRNHGSVPLLQYESHTLTVSPLPGAGEPTVFSMHDIETLFEPTELLLTIACDGNRRGEVNMVKKSGGFSWSAGGVSTCRWKGALVRDVLLRCGITGETKDGQRLYLNYEGADEPSEGAYATSIPLEHAMDKSNDVLLVYGINGRRLSPDHGYPLRSMIPGYVGGRQVKWLKKLWISTEPNRSHYHIWDNRVVPSFIDDKNSAMGKAFFHHPDTACNEQVLQSIICRPAHEELVPLTGEKGLGETYSIRGFAYNGGGLAVEKVELTLDDGKTWKYCFRRLPDQPVRHGTKFWAWTHWYCEVDLSELANAGEIRVRAWSLTQPQPEEITWNYLGMMNNSQYRVKSTLTSDPSTNAASIQFKHPVAPGCIEGGWMKPNPEEVIKAQAATAGEDLKKFSLEEVEKHASKDDAWIILNNNIYDVTSVLDWHPGGSSAILSYAGKATVEASISYSSIHDGYANEQRDKLLVGKLGQEGIKALEEDAKRAAEKEKATKQARAEFSVNPFRYVPATLLEKKELSEDTKLYTFSLPQKKDGQPKLGLPVGKHITCAVHFKDGVVLRQYTPIRPVLPSEDDGTFDLLVKTYFPESSPFPPGGTMGNYLDTMQVGEELDIKGPEGEIEYKGNGEFLIDDKSHHFDRVNLVAGGSGLTPHWQLIHSILSSDDDPTEISLINSNKTFNDILLFDELEQYRKQEEAKGEGSRFKLWYTLTGDDKPEDWKYGSERLDENMLREHLFGLETDGDKKSVGVFLCGPPGLIEHGAMPGLKKMGFEEDKNLFGF